MLQTPQLNIRKQLTSRIIQSQQRTTRTTLPILQLQTLKLLTPHRIINLPLNNLIKHTRMTPILQTSQNTLIPRSQRHPITILILTTHWTTHKNNHPQILKNYYYIKLSAQKNKPKQNKTAQKY